MTPLAWGTTRINQRGYRGRVHIVRAPRTKGAWCGLELNQIWDQRPAPLPGWPPICPECAINFLAATYPTRARQ